MLADVRGLHDLMSNKSLEPHLPAAHAWCQLNLCKDVEDIIEAEYEGEFAAALGLCVFQKKLLMNKFHKIAESIAEERKIKRQRCGEASAVLPVPASDQTGAPSVQLLASEAEALEMVPGVGNTYLAPVPPLQQPAQPQLPPLAGALMAPAGALTAAPTAAPAAATAIPDVPLHLRTGVIRETRPLNPHHSSVRYSHGDVGGGRDGTDERGTSSRGWHAPAPAPALAPAPAPAPAQTSTSNAAVTSPLPESYTTVDGNETTKTVAKKFSVDLDELVQLNTATYPNLKKSSAFEPGTKLKLPQARAEPKVQQPAPNGPQSWKAGPLFVEYAKKVKPILGLLEPQSRSLQYEIDAAFHHNKCLYNRFTKDGAGMPEAFLFFQDAPKQRVVGAVALYGNDIRTMIVCSAARRRGYGREIVQYLTTYAREQGKKELKLMCKPKHSGSNAPEFFYEKVGFVQSKTQDVGLLDLKCNRPAHDRRVKMKYSFEELLIS